MATTYIKTRDALAKALGITRVTLYRFIAMPGFPKPHKTHGYDVDEVRAFVSEKSAESRQPNSVFADSKGGDSGESASELKRKEISVKVRRQELELAIRKGEYIQRDLIFADLAGAVARTQTIMMRHLVNELPDELLGLPTREAIAEKMKTAVNMLLRDLHNEAEKYRDRRQAGCK